MSAAGIMRKSIMSFPSCAGGAFAAALAFSPCAGAQVLMQKDVSARLAWAVIEAATAHCEQQGYSITVAVVDRVGRLISQSADAFNMPELFAGVVILAVAGIVMTAGFTWIERVLVPWTRD